MKNYLEHKLKHGSVYCGDALDVLSSLDTASIECCVTSPPYWGLRDYGTASWEGGDPQCSHVADPKATKVFGNQDFNRNRPSREETKTKGYYADVCPQCGALRKDSQIGLESTIEQYIDKLCSIFAEVHRVLCNDGSLWVNMGDTYSGSGREGGNDKFKYAMPDKSLCMIPFRFAIEMVNRGWILRNTIIWHKPNCMPSSAKDRFTVDFEYMFFFVKRKQYHFVTQYEPCKIESIKRSLRGVNSNKYSEGDYLPHRNPNTVSMAREYRGYDNLDSVIAQSPGRIMRSVWTIPTKPLREKHFASFPRELIRTPIAACCKDNGIVLDPFLGSGTTAIEAISGGKRFIGIDLNSAYVDIAVKRIREIEL